MSQTHVGSDRESTTSTPPSIPRWVKVSGIIVIVLILLVGIMMLTGARPGGGHGPNLHMPPTEQGVQQP